MPQLCNCPSRLGCVVTCQLPNGAQAACWVSPSCAWEGMEEPFFLLLWTQECRVKGSAASVSAWDTALKGPWDLAPQGHWRRAFQMDTAVMMGSCHGHRQAAIEGRLCTSECPRQTGL